MYKYWKWISAKLMRWINIAWNDSNKFYHLAVEYVQEMVEVEKDKRRTLEQLKELIQELKNSNIEDLIQKTHYARKRENEIQQRIFSLEKVLHEKEQLLFKNGLALKQLSSQLISLEENKLSLQKTLSEYRNRLVISEDNVKKNIEDKHILQKKIQDYEEKLKTETSQELIRKYKQGLRQIHDQLKEKIINEEVIKNENQSLKLLITELSSDQDFQREELKRQNEMVEKIKKNMKAEKATLEETIKHKEIAYQESEEIAKLAERWNTELQQELEKRKTKIVEKEQEYNELQKRHEINLEKMGMMSRELEENRVMQSKLSTKKKNLLEKDYDLRFKHLYSNCEMDERFLKDFFALSSMERLQVEAVLADLRKIAPQNNPKVRKNIVRTKKQNYCEMGWGNSINGRIYFYSRNDTYILKRISREKDGGSPLSQTQVIEWLKKYA